MSKNKAYTHVSLFSGAGGLDIGLEQAGFHTVWANDFNHDACETHRLWSNATVVEGDIGKVDYDTIPDCDIASFGFPCQGFSLSGLRKVDDSRNVLYRHCVKLVEKKQPKLFLAENVKGLLTLGGGKIKDAIIADFESKGYAVSINLVNAADYGVPQLRERVILVGFLGDNPFQYPEPTHGEGLLPYVTLHDALKDLPALSCGKESTVYAAPPDNEFLSWVRQGGSDTLTEHKAPNNSAHLRKIMAALKDGQGKDDLPEELRPKSGFKNTYAKLWWEKPATTITRNFACPSSSRCIHPRDSRALTIREGARLQSFPDNYQFYGSDCLKRLEIGNAVPPLLSVALAEQMLKALNAEK